MQTILYILKILYKKRWWIFIVPLLSASLVYFVLSRQPKTFKSSTTIYTGIVSGYDVLSSTAGSQDWMAVNNAIDNLISIVKAESTLENVSLKLLSRNLVNINPDEDNEYMTVKSSKNLAAMIPADVFDLVVNGNEDSTYVNLKRYYDRDRTNALKQLFHWQDRHYSYEALSKVEVGRISNSDMIRISYENDDQYIVFNTLQIIVSEFIDQYVALRYEQTNDVVLYFETELERIRNDLTAKENNLTDYNTANQIINYEEQTKQVSERSKGIDISIEEMERQYKSATQRIELLERQMENVASLYKENADFIGKLNTISTLYTQSSNASDDSLELTQRIEYETQALKDLSHSMSANRFTKEGLSVDAITSQWLDAILTQSRSKAELEVLKHNKDELVLEFERFSPVGSSLKRQNRDIEFSEKNYLSNLNALNDARLRQKNLQLSSATFKILTPPTVAVSPERTKNNLYTVITFLLAMVLLMVIEVIAELLNRKPYDRASAEKITGIPVLGAFPMFKNGKYDQICGDFALNQIGNGIVNFFDRSKTNNIINIISLEKEEGKTYVSQKLYSYFEKLETKPLCISWNKDFDADSKYYLMASSIYDFGQTEENFDILPEAGVTIVEYPPLYTASFPTKLLASAAVNIIIFDTERPIKGMDLILMRQLKENSPNAKIYSILNGADVDSVGSFTGMLPPFNIRHRIRYAMWNLGNANDSTVDK